MLLPGWPSDLFLNLFYIDKMMQELYYQCYKSGIECYANYCSCVPFVIPEIFEINIITIL